MLDSAKALCGGTLRLKVTTTDTLENCEYQQVNIQAEVDYFRIQRMKVMSLGSAVALGASSSFIDTSVPYHRSRQGAWPKVAVVYIMAISSASRVKWIAVRAGSEAKILILWHRHHDLNVFSPPWSYCSCITSFPGSSQ